MLLLFFLHAMPLRLRFADFMPFCCCCRAALDVAPLMPPPLLRQLIAGGMSRQYVTTSIRTMAIPSHLNNLLLARQCRHCAGLLRSCCLYATPLFAVYFSYARLFFSSAPPLLSLLRRCCCRASACRLFIYYFAVLSAMLHVYAASIDFHTRYASLCRYALPLLLFAAKSFVDTPCLAANSLCDVALLIGDTRSSAPYAPNMFHAAYKICFALHMRCQISARHAMLTASYRDTRHAASSCAAMLPLPIRQFLPIR